MTFKNPLTPLGWAISALAVVIVIAVIVWIANWDPFGSKQRLETKAANAELQATTAGMEVEAAEVSAQRVEVVVRTRESAQQSVSNLSRDAQGATDANQPLPADRAQRLRDHDKFLCELRPLQGCPAAAGADATGGR